MLQFRYTMEVIENGEFVQEFEISNALALEFDIVENKLYWINTLEKVSTVYYGNIRACLYMF